jgi:hypothetical protein
MTRSILGAAFFLLSIGAANAWSEQNCKAMCRLTAAASQVEGCYARIPCAKYASGKHESDAYVRKRAADWNAKNAESAPPGADRDRYICQTAYASARFKALEDACVARRKGQR